MTAPLPSAPLPNSYWLLDRRLAAGEYPGDRHPDRVLAKLRRLLDTGIDTFVDLTEEGELAPYDAILHEEARARDHQARHVRLPIRDADVPTTAELTRILDVIDEQLLAGRACYVHCWGGAGRTGTVAGAWLVRHGADGDAALARVGELFATMDGAKLLRHPEGSPQLPAQRALVRDWARLDARRPRPGDHPVCGDEPWMRHVGRRPVRSFLRGCLLGGAVGDALGWPVEFLSLAAIRARYGADGIAELDPAADGGLGAITDDTQMTLFTAEGILRSTARHVGREDRGTQRSWTGPHAPHPDVMRHAYRRWWLTQNPGAPRDDAAEMAPGVLLAERRLHVRRAPGNTCLSALSVPYDGDWENATNGSKGCGGVMRVAPIGLVPTVDAFAYAVMAAGLTHGHPTGKLAAGAYAHIVASLHFDRRSLRDAVERALARLAPELGHEETSAALRAALALADEPGEPSPERVERLGGGWTAEEALAIGVYCALVARDFAHGVRLAVNHSGDSDSTGSIAGALLGVVGGEDAIPARWLDALELRDVIEMVADDLHVGYGGGRGWRTRYPEG